jgi:hypothetical protein
VPPCQYRIDDFWSEKGRVQHPADVGRVDILSLGDFFDGGEVSSFLVEDGPEPSEFNLRGGLDMTAGLVLSILNPLLYNRPDATLT